MRIGSSVIVTSGTHKGLEGKVIAIVESEKKKQEKIMGDE